MKKRECLKSSGMILSLFVAGYLGTGGIGSLSANASVPNPTVSSSPAPTPSPSPSVVHVNPDTLRSLMIQGNPSLVTEMNHVIQSKDTVRKARNSLLPTANLSTALTASSPITFSIASISILAPFLIPSNWLDFTASKHNLDAEELGYKILELNTYASVYALYETLIEDQNLETMLAQEYDDWQDILTVLQRENLLAGTASQQDIDTAQAQTSGAKGSMLAMQQTISAETAALEYALGIGAVDQAIAIDPQPVSESQYENGSIATTVKHSVDIAPEAQQLIDLIAAGNNGTWGDIFGWLNGGTSIGVGSSDGSGKSTLPALSSATVKGSFSFGLAAFPEISLDQDQTDALKISLSQLTDAQTQTLETAIHGLQDATQELAADSDAEEAAGDAYEIEKRKYDLGVTNMVNLLTDFNAAKAASITRIEAQANVDGLRITLKRAMLEDEFSKLPGCQPAAKQPAPKESIFSKIGHGIGDIFSGAHSTQTLDQFCGRPVNNQR